MKNKTLSSNEDLLSPWDMSPLTGALLYGTEMQGHSYREMYMGREFTVTPVFRYPCPDAPRIEDMEPMSKN